MTKYILICAVFVFISNSFTAAGKTPLTDFVKPCDADDPKLNECVADAANKIMPFLSKGIKDYGVVPIDPLKVPKMDVGQESGSISLTLQILDSVHTGIGTTTIKSASIDLKKGRMVFNCTQPHYTLEGRYIGKGKILLLPIVGDGHANFTLINTDLDIVIEGQPKKINNDFYFHIDSLKTYFRFKKTYMSLTNLFNGNKELGESTNKFLNENSSEVMNGLKGPLQDVYSALYKGIISKLLDSVPYKMLFKNVKLPS